MKEKRPPPKQLIQQDLSNVLRSLMQKKGLTDAELASRTHLPCSSITKLRLKYSSNPTIETLVPIAEYFGVDLEQLLGRKEIEGIPQTPTQAKMPSFQAPLIEVSEIRAWLRGELDLPHNHPHVITGVPMSDRAFALRSEGSMVTPVFPDGAALIFDKLKDREVPKDCTYVAAMVAKQEKAEGAFSLDDFPPAELPGIKQIRYDGNDFFLASLNPVLGGLLSNPPCLILAVLRQIQVTA